MLDTNIGLRAYPGL